MHDIDIGSDSFFIVRDNYCIQYQVHYPLYDLAQGIYVQYP